jgi:hypothetical protein
MGFDWMREDREAFGVWLDERSQKNTKRWCPRIHLAQYQRRSNLIPETYKTDPKQF